MLTTELRLGADWFALGLSTDETERLQGFHAPHVLVIFDEASGIPDPLWEAADSLMVGAGSHWVVVGNPLEPSWAFHRCFEPDSGWTTMTISCETSPNVIEGREVIPGLVSKEWVEQKRQEWGEDSPLFASRVKGEFPVQALSRVIQPAWVDQCVQRIGSWPDRALVSADIADFGEDETVMYGWEGHQLADSMENLLAALAEPLVALREIKDGDL